MQVTTLKTAKEALQALQEQAFDIVLKNHDPESDINACRFLRKAAGSIPVVGELMGLLPVVTAATVCQR